MKHFHEKLQEEHGITLSYAWVKLAMHGAGLMAKALSAACTGGGKNEDRWRE